MMPEHAPPMPDGYAEGTVRALNVLIQHGEVAAALIVIEDCRAQYPAFADELAAKFAEELQQ